MQWRIKNKSEGNNNNEVNETAHTDSSFLNKFKGKCYKCRETGHKAIYCLENKNGGLGGGNGREKAKFTGMCNNCRQVGHKADKYWEKERNAHLRPKNYKTKAQREKGSNAANVKTIMADIKMKESKGTEFFMASIDVPNE